MNFVRFQEKKEGPELLKNIIVKIGHAEKAIVHS